MTRQRDARCGKQRAGTTGGDDVSICPQFYPDVLKTQIAALADAMAESARASQAHAVRCWRLRRALEALAGQGGCDDDHSD